MNANFDGAASNLPLLMSEPTLPTFQKVGETPSPFWKKIHESNFNERIFHFVSDVAIAIAYTVVVLPVALVITAINAIGLLALGLFSPALLHPTSAKVWRTVKNKIFGLFTDLYSLPNLILVMPLAFKANASTKRETNNRPLVVFVHGFLHNRTCFESLAHKLTEKTKSTLHPITQRDIYSINLGKPITIEEIDHFSKLLATKLEQIRINRNLETMDVVLDAHSMGGLVSALFEAKYASLIGVNVLRIITNGTPWQGAPLAAIASFTKCGNQMTVDHPFQTDLAKAVKPKGNKYFTIASKGDTLVPFDSARGSQLDIPEDHRFTLDFPFGHVGLLYSEQNQDLNIRLLIEAIS